MSDPHPRTFQKPTHTRSRQGRNRRRHEPTHRHCLGTDWLDTNQRSPESLPTPPPETIRFDGLVGLTAMLGSYPALTVVMLIEGAERDDCGRGCIIMSLAGVETTPMV